MTTSEEENVPRSVALPGASTILSARQRAEEELQQANEALEVKSRELARSLSLMRATLEATNDAILVTDSAGAVTEFNEQFTRMWRLTRDVLATRQHFRYLESSAQLFDDPAAFLDRVKQIYDSHDECADELRLKDGRVIERFSKIQFIDDSPTGRVWSFRDVTERRLADEARSRLAAVIESSQDAIVTKTLDGVITSWNAGAQRIFGYTAEEAIGKPVLMLIPKDRAHEELVILAKLRAGERFEHYDTQRVRKDGSFIHVSLTVSPVIDEKGRVIGASKIARDITDRKEAEERLKRAAIEREALLEAERAARSEAERVSIMKDEFLATLSHELRTPLSAILGWSQLLATGKADPEDFEQGLEAIERNARAQTQLIEDLLDMSRIISGKVRLDVQWADLASVVEAAVDSVRPSADAKGIRLRKIIDPNAGPVSGDPTRLQQIVWNLLSNAIKFTPKGGKVEALLQRVNSHVEITIHDSGIGIKPEFLPLVFERFRQGDSSTTRSFGGLGLGLSIVKNLVELHGGTVRAKSDGEGQGATFIVSLPLAPIRSSADREHPRTATGPTPSYEQLDLRGVRVLVVDDEPDARALLQRVLVQSKAEVTTAASADDALQLLRQRQPHVIVSDIGMPAKDGYQFIRELRTLPDTSGGRIPAIALTAFARSEDRTRAMIAGYQIHIAKPIEPQELLATVASLAGRTGKSAL